ncbi:DUF6714 family protein [Aquimarina aquimarini]|uniref:DUF6714 family protein n=1 Tax=Aquimarina aquimarini TaxID=1191734 RepID=UPI000D55D609|nr:DUF6714 family protein [Aquimarina aquimarini]
MKKIDLIIKIEEAFNQQKYPGDEKLVYDNSGKHLECIEVKELFKNKKWQELPNNFLFEASTSLNFFSKEAFKYYLPSFMIFSLKEYVEADGIPDVLVNLLTLPSETDIVLLANAIKKHKIDMAMNNLDFNKILQNNLKNTDQLIHQFFEKVNLFTKEQNEAILQFLQFIDKNHSDDFFNNEPQTAINRYWFIYN